MGLAVAFQVLLATGRRFDRLGPWVQLLVSGTLASLLSAPVGVLLDKARERLVDRAAQAGMELVVAPPAEDLASATVRAVPARGFDLGAGPGRHHRQSDRPSANLSRPYRGIREVPRGIPAARQDAGPPGTGNYRMGTISNATMLMILISGLIAGPAVSL